MVAAVGVVALAAAGGLLAVGLPSSAAGMAAKTVCSGVFVAGRASTEVIRRDVRPASLLLQAVSVDVDRERRAVTATMPGSPPRHALYREGLGCTLLAPGAAPARAALPLQHAPGAAPSPPPDPGQPWPAGNAAWPRERWPSSVDAAALAATIDAAFDGPATAAPSDPDAPATNAANTRSVVVVHQGRLLAERYAPGFDADTPQHGWSMAKSVLSLLVWSRLAERSLSPHTPAVDAMRGARRPDWADAWSADTRRAITIGHLLTMRDGLDHEESRAPWSSVPRMLWQEPDIAAWAASAPLAAAPGSRWRYLSPSSNLLSRVLRALFDDDAAYWDYPRRALFGPIGASSGLVETDASGTFIGSSYAWATARDWARLGQLMLQDGRWNGRQVIAPGWRDFATRRAADADLSTPGYGALVWLAEVPAMLGCADGVAPPADTFVMSGHWGQTVAVIPSLQAVIVRTGWAAPGGAWNACRFVARVAQALR